MTHNDIDKGLKPALKKAPVLKIASDENEFAALAAATLVERLEGKDSPLLVLPTGNTPLGMYRVLIEQYKHRQDIWSKIRFLELDEYCGLAAEDERQFQNWLARVFLDEIGITPERRTLFRSDAADPHAETHRIEDFLTRNGPIDLAVLGLGGNGHIAFNEPGTKFDATTRQVTLTDDTATANAVYWGGIDRVPKTAFTLGLGSIATARETILLVNGAHKADILRSVLNDEISPAIPATYLRQQNNVTIIVDRQSFPES